LYRLSLLQISVGLLSSIRQHTTRLVLRITNSLLLEYKWNTRFNSLSTKYKRAYSTNVAKYSNNKIYLTCSKIGNVVNGCNQCYSVHRVQIIIIDYSQQ